jgi:hypothetical protein
MLGRRPRMRDQPIIQNLCDQMLGDLEQVLIGSHAFGCRFHGLQALKVSEESDVELWHAPAAVRCR